MFLPYMLLACNWNISCGRSMGHEQLCMACGRAMKVAIIGAGATGLCCARHFGQFPRKFNIQVFEQTSRVGGTWVYSERTDKDELGLPVHSSMYKNLKTNLPKEIMAFPGFPFNPDLPSYIYHYDMLEYLEQYTAHYNLYQFIKFQTLVEQVVPVELKPAPHAVNGVWTASGGSAECGSSKFRDSVRWRVTTREVVSGKRNTEEFDAVLVCNGHYFRPYTPDIAGLAEFSGTVYHSHVYRQPEPFSNQRVLIVGAGPSGRDIMLEISHHAKAVYLCNCRTRLRSKLPSNVEELPAIEFIRSNGTVQFVSGDVRQVDSIVVCTGYEYEFPFLTEESGIRVENKRIIPLYKHTFNATHPSMAILGINLSVLPFPYFDLQVRWVLSVWSGEKKLPSSADLIKDSDEDYQKRLEKGYPPHYAHKLATLQWDFFNELAEMSGTEPLDPVIQSLYEESTRGKTFELCTYKNDQYEVVSKDKWIRVTRVS